jgi:long-chain fatty acid transport protein
MKRVHTQAEKRRPYLGYGPIASCGLGAVLGCCLLGGTPAWADDGNYQNFIIGERAQGMGGAVGATASALDACFFNPAGLARVQHDTLSISANLYGFQKYRAENALAVGEDLKRNSFVSIPAAVTGILKTEGPGVWAFSAFIPDQSTYNEITTYLDKKHFYAFSENDQTLWVGPSFGYPFSDQFLVGASVFGVYRSFNRMENVSWGDINYAFSDDLKYNSFGLLAVLGAQYKLDPEWNLGLTLQSPAANLMGSGTFSATEVSPETGSAALFGDNLKTGNALPAKVTASVGWEKPKDRAVGLDLTYHFPCSYDVVSGALTGVNTPSTSDSSRLTRASVVDVNVGGEYYLHSMYPVRLGFFTSHSSAPDVNPTGPSTDYRIPQIDKYGFTASVGRETKNMATNFGLIYLFGSGDAYGWQLNDQGTVVPASVEAKEQHLYLFLSTSFYF